MVFSPEWEKTYSEQRHTNNWPWSDLVTHVMRYARPSGPSFTVLELGPGNGPNIPFFKALGADYHGIEGSTSAQQMILEEHPDLTGKVVVGDFTISIPFAHPFDLIVDRGALTHNATTAIQSCIRLIHQSLKPQGCFMGISWFSQKSSEYLKGKPLEGDPYTLKNIDSGRCAHLGRVHFSNREHIQDLFRDFDMMALNESVRTHLVPDDGSVESFFNFVVKKRE